MALFFSFYYSIDIHAGEIGEQGMWSFFSSGLELWVLLWREGSFSSYAWLHQAQGVFFIHNQRQTKEISHCKFRLLAIPLANHMGVKMTSMSLKSVEELKHFHPPLGFEPATRTSVALAEHVSE